jgi:hypothetical protein
MVGDTSAATALGDDAACDHALKVSQAGRVKLTSLVSAYWLTSKIWTAQGF